MNLTALKYGHCHGQSVNTDLRSTVFAMKLNGNSHTTLIEMYKIIYHYFEIPFLIDIKKS